jgi:hypothetical protein
MVTMAEKVFGQALEFLVITAEQLVDDLAVGESRSRER